MNMQHYIEGNLFVLVLNDQQPSDAEWNDYLNDLAGLSERIEQVRTLVITRGGGPNTQQRGQLKDTLGKRVTNTAVVTDAFMSQTIVRAISWFNPSISVFSTGKISKAFKYLGISKSKSRQLLEQIRQMQISMGEWPI
jgi:hypothetical protein